MQPQHHETGRTQDGVVGEPARLFEQRGRSRQPDAR